jgi:ankyrin repeat protein
MNFFFGTPGPIPSGAVDSIDVIKKMLAKGVDVNARMTKNGMKDGQRNRVNRLGATPFFLAAKVTDVEAMRVLIAGDADPSIPTAENTTPLMVAAGLDLWNPGEDGGSLPGQEGEVLEAVKMCVALGNDVNAVNALGETALHGVGFRGINTVAEFLVEQGAKLDARDENGWIPWAIAHGFSYSDFYKAQKHTATLLAEYMAQRGMSTDGEAIPGSVCFDCLQTRRDQLPALLERDERMEAEFAAQLAAERQR